MTHLMAFALQRMGGEGDIIHLMIGFLVVMIVIAVFVLSFRYICRLAQWSPPPELMAIAGLILFLVCMVVLLNWSGYYRF